jgi:hypothetical protein
MTKLAYQNLSKSNQVLGKSKVMVIDLPKYSQFHSDSQILEYFEPNLN